MNKLLILCLLPVAIGAVAVLVFKAPSANLLVFGFLLLCPLLHVFMMKGMQKGENKKKKDSCH